MKKMNKKGVNNTIEIAGLIVLVFVTVFGIIVCKSAHSSNSRLEHIEKNSTLTKDYLKN